jgi:hypothetical protein
MLPNTKKRQVMSKYNKSAINALLPARFRLQRYGTMLACGEAVKTGRGGVAKL